MYMLTYLFVTEIKYVHISGIKLNWDPVTGIQGRKDVATENLVA